MHWLRLETVPPDEPNADLTNFWKSIPVNRSLQMTLFSGVLWTQTACCLLLVVHLLGCPQRHDDPNSRSRPSQIGVEWRCDNPEMIWVDSVTGFGLDLRCGQLGGPALSTIVTFPQTVIPQQVTVTWWQGRSSIPDPAEVRKSTIAVPLLHLSEETSLLVLTFDEKHEWSAHWNVLRE